MGFGIDSDQRCNTVGSILAVDSVFTISTVLAVSSILSVGSVLAVGSVFSRGLDAERGPAVTVVIGHLPVVCLLIYTEKRRYAVFTVLAVSAILAARTTRGIGRCEQYRAGAHHTGAE